MAHAVTPARLDHIEGAADRDVDDELRLLVEMAGAVDRAQMHDAIDARDRLGGRFGVPDVPGDEFDAAGQVREPPRMAAPMIVEDAHPCALADEPPHQCGAEKPAAAGHEIGPRRHACAPDPAAPPWFPNDM